MFRTPASINSRQILLNTNRIAERMSTATAQMGTGKRIVTVSDDPTSVAVILDMQTTIDANKQFVKQIDRAIPFLRASEESIKGVLDVVERALELGQQGLSSTTTGAARDSIAEEIDGLKTHAFHLSNSMHDGKYIFSGTLTTTQPFTETVPGTVDYNGNLGTVSVDVTKTSSTILNIPGSTLFYGAGGQGSATDIFRQIIDLRDALRSDNAAGIQAAYDNLKLVQDNLTQNMTTVGARQATLVDVKDSLTLANVNLQAVQNQAQDTNYPETINQFNQDNIANQATLSSFAKINRENLFNYIA